MVAVGLFLPVEAVVVVVVAVVVFVVVVSLFPFVVDVGVFCFVFLLFLFVSVVVGSCAIMESGNYQVFDVSASYFNTTDRFGTVTANLCLDMERTCAHTTDEPCSVCQFPGSDSYCIGFSRDEQYVALDQTLYPGKTGFRAVLTGDLCGAPYGARVTNIDVLCNQPADSLDFKGENETCVYHFVLNLKSNCVPSAASFTPSFSITSVTQTSIYIEIDHSYPWMFWTYNVMLGSTYYYQGVDRSIHITGLTPGTHYNVVVERVSGYGAALTGITSPSTTQNIQTLAAAPVVTPRPSPTPYVAPTDPPAPTPTSAPVSYVVEVSGQGGGIAIGMVIAIAIGVALFGLYKFTKTDWFQEKVGGGFGGSKKGGFSLVDAEKSTAFE